MENTREQNNRISGESVFYTVFLVTACAVLMISRENTSVRVFSVVFSSIVLEAMPFMIIGSILGGLIEEFVSREKVTGLLPAGRWYTPFITGCMGLVLPVCECGIVPVVRRLAGKGMPPSAAVSYLIGGPIVNVIVAGSTWMAYRPDSTPVILRLSAGYFTAVAAGFFIEKFCGKDIYIENIKNHSHKNIKCSCGYEHEEHKNRSPLKRVFSAARHASDDFLGTTQYLIIGAWIAAAANTWIPRTAFSEWSGHHIISIIIMMFLAVSLNLCSEADAFIAASFRGIVMFPAQFSFLLLGPTFDLKLLMMYRTLFRKKTIIYLSLFIITAVFAQSLFLEYAGGFSG